MTIEAVKLILTINQYQEVISALEDAQSNAEEEARDNKDEYTRRHFEVRSDKLQDVIKHIQETSTSEYIKI